VKIIGGLALISAASWVLRKRCQSHPFWHVCIGGFVADAMVYLPDLIRDYMPFFAIPGFMAVAWSQRRGGPSETP
jgi:hypothetical protein